MTFTPSTPKDITEGLPAELTTKTEAASSVARGRIRWDLSIGGIGFVLGINDQSPYIRESAPVQKQQFDASQEAGEQTLDGFWIRSQTSWHLGAGVNFYEPGARDGLTPSAYRYKTSVGVDVWREGDLRLLKKMQQITSTSKVWRIVAINDGNPGFIVTDGTRVWRYNDAGALVWTSTAFLDGQGGLNHNPVAAGDKVLIADTTGIYSINATDGSAPTKLWSTTGAITPARPYWAKSRIIAFYSGKVYELSLAGGDLTTATALFTPPAPISWVGVADTPGAILLAGKEDGSGRSIVYSLTLETDSGGATPKLGQPFQVAELPTGETLFDIASYLGSFVVLATSLGVRVGVVGDAGRIQYGPITTYGVAQKIAFSDHYAYVYMGTKEGANLVPWVARVDLGSEITESGVYAWAPDAVIPTTQTGSAGGIAVVAGQVAVANGYGFMLQSLTKYEPTGYLLSGGVRYGTTEPKAFRSADVRCNLSGTTGVTLSSVAPNGSETGLVTLNSTSNGSNLSLASLPQKLEYLSYKLTLRASDDGTTSPVVESIALKAVPAPKKVRMFQYPVKLADKLTDPYGVVFGVDGYASKVVAALEQCEDTQAVVQVHDYRTGEQFSGVIDSFQFVGSTPGSGGRRGGGNFGGNGKITIRRV